MKKRVRWGISNRKFAEWIMRCNGECQTRQCEWWNARHQSGATPEWILDQLALELTQTEHVQQRELPELARLPDRTSSVAPENKLHQKCLRWLLLSKAGGLARQCVYWCVFQVLRGYGTFLVAYRVERQEYYLPVPQSAPEALQQKLPLPATSCPIVDSK